MYSYLKYNELVLDSDSEKKLIQLYENYMNHKFNLLGSGFVTVDYEINANGLHGYRYTDKSMRLFGKLAKMKLQRKCSACYSPINWFVDYKSGFFFNPIKYTSLVKCQEVIGKKRGVEIKCPWELGRFYHLVQMAVLAAKKDEYRENIINEFKNELIDFWSLNPIEKTVQWSAPMDVSIRMVNLLTAYDILRQIDNKKCLGTSFQMKFEKHIYDSLKFVMEYLEYGGKGAGSNHYLSNLAGILFAAAYLESDEWTDECMVFALQELIDQTEMQFYEEGADFEGSTSYHRLSTEFVLYPTALVYGVLKTQRREVFRKYNNIEIKRLKRFSYQKYDLETKEFFPKWYLDRLCNMGIFTKAVLKDNNEISQVGDNDSGRLMKLTPMCAPLDKDAGDNVLDHRTLLSAMGGLFSNDEFAEYKNQLPLEVSLIKAISGAPALLGNIYNTQLTEYGDRNDILIDYQYMKENVIYEDTKSDSLLDGLRINYFSSFGIVVLRSNRMFLSMVIDTARNAKYMGHTHNDKLSIELMIDGRYVTRDPGGYMYTAIPEIRDKFRSVKAHNTIHISGKEQNAFNGTFNIRKRAKAELLYCCRDSIIAYAEYEGISHLREIRIKDNQIVVVDYSDNPFTVSFTNKFYSTGYGELKRRKLK